MPHQCTGCGYVFEDGSKEMLGGCPECGGTTFQFHPKGADVPDEPLDATPPEPDVGGMAERVGRATTTVRDWMSGRSADGSRGGSAGAPRDASDGGRVQTGGDGAGIGPGDGDGEAVPSADAAWPDDPRGTGDSRTDRSGSTAPDDGIVDADAVESPDANPGDAEDAAQASARRDLAEPEDLPDSSSGPSDAGALGHDASDSRADRPPAEGRVVREPTDERPDLDELRAELNDQFESIRIVEPGQYELNLMELYDREEYVVALQENGRYVIQMPEDWLGPRDEDG